MAVVEILFGFFVFIITLFAYLFSTGEEKQQVKEDLKELSKTALIPFVVFVIVILFFVVKVIDHDNKVEQEQQRLHEENYQRYHNDSNSNLDKNLEQDIK
ncbi:fucose 4-O-acetylase [Bacillus thuringiensis]|uniref:Fucose 4-O-acetylase n=1 Tax=Bacillus thuringiensis TaxID=1428 RepID=A0A9X6YFJ9_BACTU|nr:fucose 4-O-acetylase [Bacillus thuringiensis]PEC75369.1 fucose 4-O-acetylase [Bacillus thuringiensis]PED12686.1 fucose 4-O-acetylase [Bacillus thuringiensis]PEF87142.1 fucose 4-O-acetylase [Bacillus thuringiensis]PES57744.1 fucose 4-O-acetylase [Bacillus thuringiensis]PFD84742.1 fucose 4-O-acetylase [Bacillus thuringiensis]